MEFSQDRSWSCYPNGIVHSRRRFMHVLSTAAAVSMLRPESLLFSQEQDDDKSVPAFPTGGFPEGATRLNFNENPLGPSPKVLQAILEKGLRDGNRYNYIDPLIDAIAKHHNLPSANVVVGCGSTEFLQFAPWAFLKSGTRMVLPVPSYGYAAGVAEGIGAKVSRVPLGPLGTVDTASMKKAIRRNTRMVYLANPNNPTGAVLSLDAIRTLAQSIPRDAVLFVDEAYNDFLPDEGAIELVRQGMPVLVTRTFSKAHGLAGLRLGYAMAPDAVMKKLKTVWWGDFGINAAARIAGPAALDDEAHVKSYVQVIDQGLSQLRGGLEQMGHKPYPHRAPFFMVDLGQRAKPLMVALYKQKIYVQDGNNWKMPNFLRVSVGLPEENEVFLKAMHELSA